MWYVKVCLKVIRFLYCFWSFSIYLRCLMTAESALRLNSLPLLRFCCYHPRQIPLLSGRFQGRGLMVLQYTTLMWNNLFNVSNIYELTKGKPFLLTRQKNQKCFSSMSSSFHKRNLELIIILVLISNFLNEWIN